jgi:hypothetical protein
MKATPAEDTATTTLRLRCQRRSVAFKVALKTDGGWRGVLFSLDAEPGAVVLSRETRLLLVQALSRVVAERWPLKRGNPGTGRAA